MCGGTGPPSTRSVHHFHAQILKIDHGLEGIDKEVAEHAPASEAVSQRKQFMCEVDIMVRLKSCYTVDVRGIITSKKNRLVLVMELLKGGDLRNFLNMCKDPLPEKDARRIIGDVCAGMAFLHGEGIVHGDLKSPNVLLDGNRRAKV